MGEIAALTTAFDHEINKAISCLGPTITSESNHDVYLAHHRFATRVEDVIEHYSSRLPAYVIVPKLVQHGWHLYHAGEPDLAHHSCFNRVLARNLHITPTLRLDESQCMSHHVQAGYGAALCSTSTAMRSDPQMKHPFTLEAVLNALLSLKASLALVFPREDLSWLTLNGTVHIYRVAKQVMEANFSHHALPFLVHLIRAVEAHVILNASKYLSWRTQLYTAAMTAYLDLGAADLAKALLMAGLAKLEQVVALQKLDPVPAAPVVQGHFKAAKAVLLALQVSIVNCIFWGTFKS
jgi:hypothetical protein